MKKIFLLCVLIPALVLAGCAHSPDAGGDAGSNGMFRSAPEAAGTEDTGETETAEAAEEASTGEADPAPAFAVPEMDAQQQAHYEDFVEPLLVCGLLMRSWSGDDFASLEPGEKGGGPFLLYAYEDLWDSPQALAAIEEFEGRLPAEMVEAVLQSFFPFSTEELHQILREHYDGDEGIYRYGGGRGGGPIEGAVTDISIGLGGDSAVIRITYELFTGYEGTDGGWDVYRYRQPGILTVRQQPDGSFRYLSVEAGDREQAGA